MRRLIISYLFGFLIIVFLCPYTTPLKAFAFEYLTYTDLEISSGVSLNILCDRDVVDSLIVKGTIYDAGTNEPLVGVLIQANKSYSSTSTDVAGDFILELTDEDDIIIISLVGYERLELALNHQIEFDIPLNEDVALLNEVIVVGYGEQPQERVSVAVDQMMNSDLEIDRRPITSLESSLVGMVPGLIIDKPSGRPGEVSSIQIRATSALVPKNALVMLDGFESTLEDLNPYDVASVSVLKDAAATAIYGARGANGVILITTKKSNQGRPMEVRYNTTFAWQRPLQVATSLNSLEYMEFYNEAEFNDMRLVDANLDQGDVTLTYTEGDMQKAAGGFYPETNWVEELYSEIATQSSHNLSIAGSEDRFNYLLSLGYLSENGTSQGPDNSERLGVRIKLESKLRDWLTFGTNIYNSTRKVHEVPIGEFNGLRGQPFFPVQLDSGPFAGTYVYKGSISDESNPMAKVNSGSYDRSVADHLNMQLYSIIEPVENLSVEFRYSYQNRNTSRSIWNNPYEYIILDPDDLLPVTDPIPVDSRSRSLEERASRSYFENMLINAKYQWALRDHLIQATAGFQLQQGKTKNLSANRFDYFISNLQSLNLGNSIDGLGNSASISTNRSVVSFFNRISYDYKSKFLLEFNLRADASSNFVKDKWGYFPAISGGWNVHNEPFFRQLKAISAIKLYASYGVNGDDGELNGTEIVITDPSVVAFGNSLQPTIALSNVVNPDLTWETSKKTNLGLNVVLWDGLISFSGDYFMDKREDIITLKVTSGESGFDGILDNVYSAKSWGWEFALGNESNWGEIDFSSNLNFSIYESKITSGEGMVPLNSNSNNYQIEGLPILGNFYGYETDGLYTSQQDLNEPNPVDQSLVVNGGDEYGRYLGGLKFVDQLTEDTNGDGIPDAGNGIIDENDRKVLKKGAVDNYRIGGLFSVSYKGFSISTRIYGVLEGYEWWNRGSEFLNSFGGQGVAPYKIQLDAWRPENQNALLPATYLADRPYENDVSFLIKDKSYIKVKNINLSYRFDKEKFRFLEFANSLEVYVSFENVGVLWTNYPAYKYGFDPEFGAIGFTYPRSLKTSIGANLSF